MIPKPNVNLIWYTFIFVLIQSCVPVKKEVTICHTESGRCIRILDEGKYRTIYFDQFLDLDYVILDVSRINRVTDGIFACFNEAKIEVVNPRTSVIKSNFDKSKYSFSNQLKLNDEGFPDILKFHQKDCFELNMKDSTIFPANESVILKK